MKLSLVVQKKNLLTHPFYQLWLEGKLPVEALQKYTGQYFHLVAHLPNFIHQLQYICPDDQTQQQLERNLSEEEGLGNGGVAHTCLWLDFAEELGVPRKEVENTEILPATQQAIQTILKSCQHSLVKGTAALYAYESQVPEISEEKIRGLQEYYNITSEKALRFFVVHSTADKKHRAVWEALHNKYATTPKLERQAAAAAEETAQALWAMFDAMYAEFVPEHLKGAC